MTEIDKDLVRWQRGKWIAVTAVIFVLQCVLLIAASQKSFTSKEIYPREPRLALANGIENVEWLEDPFLFASATWNGFSASAWLKAPEWKPPEAGRPVPVRYLNFSEAGKITEHQTQRQPFAFARRTKPGPVFPAPMEDARPVRHSQLRIEGLPGRTLVEQPGLPPQQHNDVLSPTVVETMVGPEGMVLSAVVIETSGSARADADALALARAARFTPRPGPGRTPEVGKLIFEWFALDLTNTNNVRTTR